MEQDPEVRREAASRLTDLFKGIGQQGQDEGTGGLGDLGGLIGQVQEFVEMPMELATIFLNMAVEMAEITIQSLEQAGFVIVKGVTPL